MAPHFGSFDGPDMTTIPKIEEQELRNRIKTIEEENKNLRVALAFSRSALELILTGKPESGLDHYVLLQAKEALKIIAKGKTLYEKTQVGEEI